MCPFTIINIYDDSKSEGLSLLRESLDLSTSDEYFLRNYHPSYDSIPSNLFKLLKKGRYREGAYQIVVMEGRYVASAGWHHYENGIIALSRAYIAEAYRGMPVLAECLLPGILSVSDEKMCPTWMTFNDSNRSIYEAFSRAMKNQSATVSFKWPEIFRKFRPIGKKEIFGYSQYVVEYQPKSV